MAQFYHPLTRYFRVLSMRDSATSHYYTMIKPIFYAALPIPLRRNLMLACAQALLSVPLFAQAAPATVVKNANGYTMLPGLQLKQFSALAMDAEGKIRAVGSLIDVQKVLGAEFASAKQIDLAGKTMLPGLIDAHGHIFSLGEAANELQLRDSSSLAQAQSLVASYAKTHPAAQWLVGFGWNQARWQLGRFPTAQELDSVTGTRPAWMVRVDGHAGWANTAALKLAGIHKNTVDPAGGKIERDAQGEPTGILVDAAMGLISKILPPSSEAEDRAALDASLRQLAALGLTSVHDAGVSASQDKLYREYASQGRLTTRVYGMLRLADLDRVAGILPSMANDHYALRAVKVFGDGALGSRGAALLTPYSDHANSNGLLFNSDAVLTAQLSKAMVAGFQVNVHAIGDKANRQVLDVQESLLANFPNAMQQRHRIEHAQVIALADIPRFAKLGVIASMQPVHATSDMNMAEARVGSERVQGAYAWRRLALAGARIACGSDFPIESANPFWGLHAAVVRQDMKGSPTGGWYTEQALSLKEALSCFTLDAAYAAHQEKVTGSLEVGKWADFIVVDQDLFKISPYDIHKIKVLQTWLGGKRVFALDANKGE